MSHETGSTITTSATYAVVRKLQQRTPTPQPQESLRPRSKSKSIVFSITNKFAPRATRNVAPSVPSPPISAEAQERREAALRQMGLRPTLTLSQQEALVDTAIPILPSPTSPKISSTMDLASEADRIKKEWESKNKSCVHDNGGAQLTRMINFKFGRSATPSLSLALEMDAAPVTDSDSSCSRPATSTSSSAAHESLSSPSRTSISELEKCSKLDFPSSCELSHTNSLSLAWEIDPSMLPLPPSPSPSRVHGDALSVISSISKASKEEAGLNGGLNSSEARAPPLPSSSSTGEADASLQLSTLDTPRVLTAAPPPPPVISLSPPDPSSEEMNSSKVSQPDCASNLDVDAGTIAPLTITRTPSLSADTCIPASSMTPATSLPEPSSDNPSQDIPVISEVSDDDLIGLVANFDFNYDGLDVVYEEPEMLSASGSTALRSGSLRSGMSAPKAARSRSALQTRGPLKVDDGGVVLEGGETNGGNLAVQKAEAEVKQLPDPPSDEGAVEQPESSAAAVAPSMSRLPLKRGMTEGGGEKKKGVFNRFKRSNTTSGIPVADTTKQSPLPPLRAKRSMTVLSSVRRRVVSTLTSRSSLDPEGSDKKFDASPYPPSPTSASSVFKSIRSVGNRSVSPAGGQSIRGLSPVRQPVAPTMHNQASIAFQTNAIEDEETRRMAELAFLS